MKRMYDFRARTIRARAQDDGFGVIEVVVAMFLLGIIAVAVIPILVQGLRLSVTNAALATATQLANQQVEQVRGVSLCSGVTATTTTTTVRSISLKASRSVATCPATYPGTVSVSVSVTRTDTNAVLATANTLVFVTGP